MFIALIILIIAIAWLTSGLPHDYLISDFFFKNGQWLWPKEDASLTFWLHDLFIYIFITIGIISLFLALLGCFYQRFKPYRYGALLLTLSLLIIPATVAELKIHTNIFCPVKLERYQGLIPDNYRNLNLPPEELRISRCFPAAHSSPGFSFFALGVAAKTRRKKILGYGLGGLMGTILTIIQIGRGEHFMSHGIASALLALWLVHAIAQVMNFIANHYKLWRYP